MFIQYIICFVTIFPTSPISVTGSSTQFQIITPRKFHTIDIFYIIVWTREVPVLFFNNSRRLCTAVSAAKEEKKPAKEKVADTKEEGEEEGAATIAELMKNKVHFHAPGQNHTTDGYMVTDNTERLLREHLARTGGQVGSKFHSFIKTSYWYLLLVYQRRIKS